MPNICFGQLGQKTPQFQDLFEQIQYLLGLAVGYGQGLCSQFLLNVQSLQTCAFFRYIGVYKIPNSSLDRVRQLGKKYVVGLNLPQLRAERAERLVEIDDRSLNVC